MTIRAYQEIYLNKAQSVLGDAFDYAINCCSFSGKDFVKLFVTSAVSKRIENGETSYVSGKSGIEIALEIILETTGESPKEKAQLSSNRSTEYWIGWAVAYYQWHSARSFSEIFKAVSYDDFEKIYPTLHEADITKLVDILDRKIKVYYIDTNLKRIRKIYGCSQSKLASDSGVSLRSIQMYEQRRKDINNASAVSLYRISKVLGCTVEDLIEK